ncbi:lamin-B receptor [Agrilus planipennis]|uniref:Lamin-B receptor n=1 Tax=Agrilus planipennis TaxID=224129 RepID=A0A1W4X3C3_AGRPL|nr:lamin-B receptor [Agrilus planipennis]XP_025834321.1 lamin-B receptor [Agrilus planipennis]
MVSKKEKSSSAKTEKSLKTEKPSALPIKVISQPTENVSKTKKRSSASPSRKSPSRKSPSRKSPSRKSPSRSQKSPIDSPKKSPILKVTARRSIGDRKSPARPTKSSQGYKKFIADTDTDSDTAEISAKLSVEKPKAAVRGRARNIDNEHQPVKGMIEIISGAEVESEVGLVRRSARISQQREVERIVHVKQDLFAQKLAEFSDDDDIKNFKYSNSEKMLSMFNTPDRSSTSLDRVSESRKFEKSTNDLKRFDLLDRYEFGGSIGALALMCFIPVTVYGINLSCNRNSCSFTKIPDLENLKKVSSYFDLSAWTAFFVFALALMISSALPFGGKKVTGLLNKEGILEYRMNGLFSAIILSTLTIALSIYGFPVVQIVTEKYFQMITASLIFGILLSVILYLRSRHVSVSALNPHAVTRSHIYNFWMGRELNPRFFGVVDVKMYLYRFVIISSLIINGIFLFKKMLPPTPISSVSVMKKIAMSPTASVLALLQGVYLLDGLLFESSWVTSFEIQYEGVGWMLAVGYVMYPFMSTTILKYVTEHNIELPWFQLVAAIILFVIGYILLRGSNSQKDSFRKNPYDPSLSHLETIPTTQGKRLLASGYWGWVRHPNYLGDILILISFTFFVKSVPPLLFCLLNILFLISRARRDGLRCKQRYGAAWDIYCQRVKYIFLPKIY